MNSIDYCHPTQGNVGYGRRGGGGGTFINGRKWIFFQMTTVAVKKDAVGLKIPLGAQLLLARMVDILKKLVR